MGIGTQRVVEGNTLYSTFDPELSIRVDPAFSYTGQNSFVLYGIADCEQHLFVEAGSDRQMKRLIWIQFEGYREHTPYTYNYSESEQMQAWGLPFAYDAGAVERAKQTRLRQDSDSAAVMRFLEEKGFKTWEADLAERYVTLSPDRRKELMIIYAEDTALHGLDPAQFTQEGEAWRSKLQELHARGMASFRIEAVSREVW